MLILLIVLSTIQAQSISSLQIPDELLSQIKGRSSQIDDFGDVKIEIKKIQKKQPKTNAPDTQNEEPSPEPKLQEGKTLKQQAEEQLKELLTYKPSNITTIGGRVFDPNQVKQQETSEPGEDSLPSSSGERSEASPRKREKQAQAGDKILDALLDVDEESQLEAITYLFKKRKMDQIRFQKLITLVSSGYLLISQEEIIDLATQYGEEELLGFKPSSKPNPNPPSEPAATESEREEEMSSSSDSEPDQSLQVTFDFDQVIDDDDDGDGDLDVYNGFFDNQEEPTEDVNDEWADEISDFADVLEFDEEAIHWTTTVKDLPYSESEDTLEVDAQGADSFLYNVMEDDQSTEESLFPEEFNDGISDGEDQIDLAKLNDQMDTVDPIESRDSNYLNFYEATLPGSQLSMSTEVDSVKDISSIKSLLQIKEDSNPEVQTVQFGDTKDVQSEAISFQQIVDENMNRDVISNNTGSADRQIGYGEPALAAFSQPIIQETLEQSQEGDSTQSQEMQEQSIQPEQSILQEQSVQIASPMLPQKTVDVNALTLPKPSLEQETLDPLLLDAVQSENLLRLSSDSDQAQENKNENLPTNLSTSEQLVDENVQQQLEISPVDVQAQPEVVMVTPEEQATDQVKEDSQIDAPRINKVLHLNDDPIMLMMPKQSLEGAQSTEEAIESQTVGEIELENFIELTALKEKEDAKPVELEVNQNENTQSIEIDRPSGFWSDIASQEAPKQLRNGSYSADLQSNSIIQLRQENKHEQIKENHHKPYVVEQEYKIEAQQGEKQDSEQLDKEMKAKARFAKNYPAKSVDIEHSDDHHRVEIKQSDDDIFIISSLASSKKNNILKLDQKEIVEEKATVENEESAPNVEEPYQELPDPDSSSQQSKLDVGGAVEPGKAEQKSSQSPVIQSFAQIYSLTSQDCAELYVGSQIDAKNFVCSCSSKYYKLEDESWYLAGLIPHYKKYEGLFEKIKHSVPQILVSTSEKEICFATQIKQVILFNDFLSAMTYVGPDNALQKVPKISQLEFFQFRFEENVFKDFVLSLKQHDRKQLHYGLQQSGVEATLKSGETRIRQLYEMLVKSQQLRFSLEQSWREALNLREETIEMNLNLPGDEQIALQICADILKLEIAEGLQSRLRHLVGHYGLRIRVFAADNEFEVSYALKKLSLQ